MKKIIITTANLNEDERWYFEKELKEVPGQFDMIHFENFADLAHNAKKGMVLFYGFKTSSETLENDLEVIHRLNVFIPINIIFFKKNFQALMLAYHYNINHVFDKRYDKEDIKRALLKFELQGISDAKVPQRALEYLLETPIKVKDDEQMFQYLKNYFKQIQSIDSFAMLKQINGEYIFLYGDEKLENKDIVAEISNCQLPEKSIGEYFHNPSLSIAFFPLYLFEEEVVWGVIESKQDLDVIFNSIFMKYLQNVHLYRKAKDAISDLTELANTDEVTGLYNQRKLAQDLERIIAEHEIENDTFSVMFIDIDHFKVVNDRYGHFVGSQMLIEIGDVLRKLLRGTDMIYRYGGDEFVVIMTKVKTDIVHKIALRILNSVKEMDFKLETGDIHKLSLSIGIAEYPKNAKTAKQLIQFADEMMYESKKSGRGKVFHLEEVADVSASRK